MKIISVRMMELSIVLIVITYLRRNQMNQYNIFTPHNQYPLFITTDVNLIEMYKAALVSGANQIMWENGIINLSQVIGIIDMTPPELPNSK
jgi:hypothetical protein